MIDHRRKLVSNQDLLKFASIILAILSLIMPIACRVENPSSEPPGDATPPRATPPHTPNKIKVHVPADPMRIAFGIITDTHIGRSANANDETVRHVNDRGQDFNILGVLHMGDMLQGGDSVHYHINDFRDYYEDDLSTTPVSHRIKFPLFPNIGNHDVSNSTNNSFPSNGDAPQYLQKRIIGAPNITSYDTTTYAWRWGNYYFLSLGLWAGGRNAVSKTDIDWDRINWVDAFLRDSIGDSGNGVFILQHYGWDWFSTELDDDGSARWWNDTMRQLLLDILCRRYHHRVLSSSAVANPYNVLGIFTGHLHLIDNNKVAAGKDKNSREVYFDNYVLPEAGTDQPAHGFGVVVLDGTTMQMDVYHSLTNSKLWSFTKLIKIGPNWRD
ncbi:MAG: hypothetical protein V1799_19285 [bacterium]